MHSKAKETYDEIKKQSRKIDYTKLVCIVSGRHQYNFTIFLDLKTFAESLYNGSFSLKVAKLKQRNLEDEIKRLEDYCTKKEKFRTQKEDNLHNAREFYKGRKIFLNQNNKQYPSENVDDLTLI